MNDQALLVFPVTSIIREIWLRNLKTKSGVRRPHIQKVYNDSKSFEYLVVPIGSSSPIPPRIVASTFPPHLALCTTSGKLRKSWGHLAGADYHVLRVGLIERSKTVTDAHPRFALDIWHLDVIREIHRRWTFTDHVPPRFLSEDSDQMVVEAEEDLDSESDSSEDTDMEWEVGSSASCHHEPRRRLLPCELEQDPENAFPSTDEDDEDDSMSSDSYLTDVDAPEELSLDHRWLKGIQSWAAGISGAEDDAMLLNDSQIKEDARERPRVATSLDLSKPDYLYKRQIRASTRIS
ncbi:hypothetical protein DFH09DRAFT_397096 [Mycena vulgaris]|nr:hypothetical protein DFH09DRAFT_397096 [Mycena vulgaris]